MCGRDEPTLFPLFPPFTQKHGRYEPKPFPPFPPFTPFPVVHTETPQSPQKQLSPQKNLEIFLYQHKSVSGTRRLLDSGRRAGADFDDAGADFVDAPQDGDGYFDDAARESA